MMNDGGSPSDANYARVLLYIPSSAVSAVSGVGECLFCTLSTPMYVMIRSRWFMSGRLEL